MRLHILVLVALSHSVAQLCLGSEKTVLSDASDALTRLKAECDVPGQTNASLSSSYISATEKARHQAIAQLQAMDGNIVPLVRAELQKATDEYREMLTVALAALRDDAAVLAAAELMVASQKAAVRVCAARELRGLKDKRTLTHFKKALGDPYSRQDGSSALVGDGKIYPVRIIASDALVELGVSVDELRKLRGDVLH